MKIRFALLIIIQLICIKSSIAERYKKPLFSIFLVNPKSYNDTNFQIKDTFKYHYLKFNKNLNIYSSITVYDTTPKIAKSRLLYYDFIPYPRKKFSLIDRVYNEDLYGCVYTSVAKQYYKDGKWIDSCVSKIKYDILFRKEKVENYFLTSAGLKLKIRTICTFDSLNNIKEYYSDSYNTYLNTFEKYYGVKCENIFDNKNRLKERTLSYYDIYSKEYEKPKKFVYHYNTKNKVIAEVSGYNRLRDSQFVRRDSILLDIYYLNNDWLKFSYKRMIEAEDFKFISLYNFQYTYKYVLFFGKQYQYNLDSLPYKFLLLGNFTETLSIDSLVPEDGYNYGYDNFKDLVFLGNIGFFSEKNFYLKRDKDSDITKKYTIAKEQSGSSRIYDIALLGYDSTINSIEDLSKKNAITLFPNPTANSFNVKIGKGFHHLMIYSSSGKMMKEDFIQSEGIKNINVASFPSGLYFIQDISKEGKAFGKFIKD